MKRLLCSCYGGDGSEGSTTQRDDHHRGGRGIDSPHHHHQTAYHDDDTNTTTTTTNFTMMNTNHHTNHPNQQSRMVHSTSNLSLSNLSLNYRIVLNIDQTINVFNSATTNIVNIPTSSSGGGGGGGNAMGVYNSSNNIYSNSNTNMDDDTISNNTFTNLTSNYNINQINPIYTILNQQELNEISTNLDKLMSEYKFKTSSRFSLKNEVKMIEKKKLFKSSTCSWFYGKIMYPLSPFEIMSIYGNECISKWRRKNRKLLKLFSEHEELKIIPKWKEFNLDSNHKFCLSTDVEDCFSNNPFIVIDKVYVILIPKNSFRNEIEKELNIPNINIKNEGTIQLNSFIEKDTRNRVFNIYSINGTLIKEGLENSNLNIEIEGKIYSIDIDGHSQLLYIYISNCGQPNLIPFIELVSNSTPPTSTTLFEPLYLDIDDTLWIKCPYLWEFIEHIHDGALLISPIQKNFKNNINTINGNLFENEKLDKNFHQRSESDQIVHDHIIIEKLSDHDCLNISKNGNENGQPVKLFNIAHARMNFKLSQNEHLTTRNHQPEKISKKGLYLIYQYELIWKDRNEHYIEAIVNTIDNHVWSLTYVSNCGSVYRNLFKLLLMEIKTQVT